MRKRLLLVMSPYEKGTFLEKLEGLDLRPLFASGVAQAECLLTRNPEIEVVVVDQELLDGTWQDVAELIANREARASLLICIKQVGAVDILAASRRVPIPDVLIKLFEPELVRERVSHALRAEQRVPLEGSSVPIQRLPSKGLAAPPDVVHPKKCDPPFTGGARIAFGDGCSPVSGGH